MHLPGMTVVVTAALGMQIVTMDLYSVVAMGLIVVAGRRNPGKSFQQVQF